MKEHLRQLVANTAVGRRRLIAREYLQARVLDELQRCGAMLPLALHGGTALRFLYSIPRFSEDLDFALERPDLAYDLRGWLDRLRMAMTNEGYRIALAINDRKVVHASFIRFRGLLHELDLSPHPDETISIKLEVDTRPPGGARCETTMVRRHVLLRLQHHDRGSLLAGKLNAILTREYTKGRDLFDLLWYLADPTWPLPNLTMLNNALRQVDWRGSALDEHSWRAAVHRRVEVIDWRRAVADVKPFLEAEDAARLLTKDELLRLLRAGE